MLSREEIEAASDRVTPAAREAWLLLFRGYSVYQQRAYAFSDLETQLTAAEGTIKARMLNALLDKIIELGSGEALLVPGSSRGGIQYSQRGERDALIDEAFRVLYDYAAMIVTIFSAEKVAHAALRTTYPAGTNRCGSCGETVFLYNTCACGVVHLPC